jgi:hypothetical protein
MNKTLLPTVGERGHFNDLGQDRATFANLAVHVTLSVSASS